MPSFDAINPQPRCRNKRQRLLVMTENGIDGIIAIIYEYLMF